MSISEDLFLAILSMDAYNRGYREGIAGLGGVGSGIGNATITQQSDTGESDPGVVAGFYAIAYEMAADVGEGDDKLLAGQISYRGREAAA